MSNGIFSPGQHIYTALSYMDYLLRAVLTLQFSSAGNLFNIYYLPGYLKLLDTEVFLPSVSELVINEQPFWFTNCRKVTIEKHTCPSDVVSLGNGANPKPI